MENDTGENLICWALYYRRFFHEKIKKEIGEMLVYGGGGKMKVRQGGMYCLIVLFSIVLGGCTGQQYPDPPLLAGGPVAEVDMTTVDHYLADISRPVVLLFYDDQYWQSKDMTDRITFFAGKYGATVQFLKYRWQKEDAPSRYGLEMLPTVILFKGGMEVDRIKGIPKDRTRLNKWNEDIELWMLKTVFDVQGDEYSGDYTYRFNNSSTLDINSY